MNYVSINQIIPSQMKMSSYNLFKGLENLGFFSCHRISLLNARSGHSAKHRAESLSPIAIPLVSVCTPY